VGVQFANDYPERLASLTLCSTPFRYSPAGQAEARRWPEQLQRMSVKDWYLQGTPLRFDPGKSDQQLIQWFADLVGRTDVDVIRAVLRFLPDIDVSGLCKRITAPTLILHPGQSIITPSEDAEAMRQAIPKARLVVYDDARHHVFLTHAETCAYEMLHFLQGLT
jgi:pimeloyl-ACP methyl ester carboxylesterase